MIAVVDIVMTGAVVLGAALVVQAIAGVAALVVLDMIGTIAHLVMSTALQAEVEERKAEVEERKGQGLQERKIEDMEDPIK